MSDQPQQPQQPTFDPDAAHQAKPKLRRVRGFPVPVKTPDGQQQTLLGLADAQQISSKMVATAPGVQQILPQLDGTKSIDDIVSAVGQGLTVEFMQNFVAQLDDAALIEGPNYEALVVQMKKDFDESDTLPPGSTAQFADALVMQKLGKDATEEQRQDLGPKEMASTFDTWIEQALSRADDPAFDTLPKAIVAPHVDYPRGWINYASVWGRLQTTDRPDRIVILGTNHFGTATGVCACDKGFETPFGTSPADTQLLDVIKSKLGADAEKLVEHRYDHEREHSIELQIPWIQHCMGPTEAGGSHVPVLGILVHDPTVNDGASYDGNGLAYQPFVDALKEALDEVGGTTLIVSSADLSHVGPAFGDQQPLTSDEERSKVETHDREMLQHVENNSPDDLVSSMSWQQNPTRWCSIGNMTAAMRVVEPESIRLLHYAGAVDQQGTTMVTHAAMVMN
ncbi:MAG: AmmeMemoRadiSam system protein B [Planctomycetota bacterium]